MDQDLNKSSNGSEIEQQFTADDQEISQPSANDSIEEGEDTAHQFPQEVSLAHLVRNFFSSPVVPLSWSRFLGAVVVLSIICLVGVGGEAFHAPPKDERFSYTVFIIKLLYQIFGVPLTAYACSIMLKDVVKAKHLTLGVAFIVVYCFAISTGITFAGEYADKAVWYVIFIFIEFFVINTHLYRNWICRYVFRLLGVAVFTLSIALCKVVFVGLALVNVGHPVVTTECEYGGSSYQIKQHSGGIVDNSYRYLSIYRKVLFGILEQELGSTDNLVDITSPVTYEGSTPTRSLVDSVQVREEADGKVMYLFLGGDTLDRVEL